MTLFILTVGLAHEQLFYSYSFVDKHADLWVPSLCLMLLLSGSLIIESQFSL